MTEQDEHEVNRLMLQFVNTMIVNGTDCPALDVMLRENRANHNFVRLAKLARQLKRSARSLPSAEDFNDLVDPLE